MSACSRLVWQNGDGGGGRPTSAANDDGNEAAARLREAEARRLRLARGRAKSSGGDSIMRIPRRCSCFIGR